MKRKAKRIKEGSRLMLMLLRRTHDAQEAKQKGKKNSLMMALFMISLPKGNLSCYYLLEGIIFHE